MGNYISPCGTLQKTRCSAGLNCKTDADCSSLNCSNGKCLAKTVLKSNAIEYPYKNDLSDLKSKVKYQH